MYLKFTNDEQKKGIYEDINATEESLKKDAQCLMEWMEKQPHLPNVKGQSLVFYTNSAWCETKKIARILCFQKKKVSRNFYLFFFIDEELLLNALVRCKNSLETTKRRLNAYYTCRAVMSDIFTNRDPDSKEFTHAMKYV